MKTSVCQVALGDSSLEVFGARYNIEGYNSKDLTLIFALKITNSSPCVVSRPCTVNRVVIRSQNCKMSWLAIPRKIYC